MRKIYDKSVAASEKAKLFLHAGKTYTIVAEAAGNFSLATYKIATHTGAETLFESLPSTSNRVVATYTAYPDGFVKISHDAVGNTSNTLQAVKEYTSGTGIKAFTFVPNDDIALRIYEV